MGNQDVMIKITRADVTRWEKERAQIDDQIKALEAQKTVLDQRLLNIRWYIQTSPSEDHVAQMPLAVGDDDDCRMSITEMSVPDAVRYVIKLADSPITKKAIKARLKQSGFPIERLGVHGSYYHTVIDRMLKNGRLLKEGERLRLNPAKANEQID